MNPPPPPIFILSSSWRSGSTLLQRFIVEPAPQNRVLGYLSIQTRPPADFTQTSQVDWKASNEWERARLRYWLADETVELLT